MLGPQLLLYSGNIIWCCCNIFWQCFDWWCTLTYEDVTNIDSVGIITAQQGIRVGAGQSIGSDGAAVVYYGDGSNLDGVVSGVEIKKGEHQ